MIELNLRLINGLMVGIEHVSGDIIDDDVVWAISFDLLVIRVVIIKWKTAE